MVRLSHHPRTPSLHDRHCPVFQNLEPLVMSLHTVLAIDPDSIVVKLSVTKGFYATSILEPVRSAYFERVYREDLSVAI